VQKPGFFLRNTVWIAYLWTEAQFLLGVAECKYDFPHPQPFSQRVRELESSSLALWERVRVRAAWQFISLFSNAISFVFAQVCFF
jgi:hypothetical protein